MKKIFCLLLTLSLVFTLSACGNNDKVDEKNENTEGASTADLKIGTPVDMDEQILYDDNDIIITAKRLEFINQGYQCADYFYEVTNNTDSDIRIEYIAFDVNGVSFNTSYKAFPIKKGETIEDSFSIEKAPCEWNDIKVIKEISFNLKILACHQSDKYEEGYAIDRVIVEKTGHLVAKTNYADKYAGYEQKINKNGTVLIDEENLSLIFTDMNIETNTDGELFLKSHVYYKNDYDFNVKFTYTLVKVNGKEIQKESNAVEIPLNSEGIRRWSESNVEYDKIETMEFTYYVTDIENDKVILRSETPVELTFLK